MSDSGSDKKARGCGCGIGSWGFGSVIAAIISYSLTHSVLWALFHAFLGWVYVAYRAFIFLF
jgi:hypothetical protein